MENFRRESGRGVGGGARGRRKARNPKTIQLRGRSRRRFFRGRRRRDFLRDGIVRVGQIDSHPPHQSLDRADRGRDSDRRRKHRRFVGGRFARLALAQNRNGFSKYGVVAAPQRARKCLFAARDPRRRKRRTSRSCRPRAGGGRFVGLGAFLSGRTFGRHATAGRVGAGARRRSAHFADGRAVFGARSAHSPPVAGSIPRAVAKDAQDHDFHHPRFGRGHPHRQPHRDYERRRAGPSRHTRRDCRRPGRRLCRRFRRRHFETASHHGAADYGAGRRFPPPANIPARRSEADLDQLVDISVDTVASDCHQRRRQNHRRRHQKTLLRGIQGHFDSDEAGHPDNKEERA